MLVGMTPFTQKTQVLRAFAAEAFIGDVVDVHSAAVKELTATITAAPTAFILLGKRCH
jgi:hypothetical protein